MFEEQQQPARGRRPGFLNGRTAGQVIIQERSEVRDMLARCGRAQAYRAMGCGLSAAIDANLMSRATRAAVEAPPGAPSPAIRRLRPIDFVEMAS